MIYFIINTSYKVKIGQSQNVESRYHSLNRESPDHLWLAFSLDIPNKCEGKLHKYFKDYRIIDPFTNHKKEWFYIIDELEYLLIEASPEEQVNILNKILNLNLTIKDIIPPFEHLNPGDTKYPKEIKSMDTITSMKSYKEAKQIALETNFKKIDKLLLYIDLNEKKIKKGLSQEEYKVYCKLNKSFPCMLERTRPLIKSIVLFIWEKDAYHCSTLDQKNKKNWSTWEKQWWSTTRNRFRTPPYQIEVDLMGTLFNYWGPTRNANKK